MIYNNTKHPNINNFVENFHCSSMSDQHTIEHTGFVDRVEGQSATVRINSISACASCHAKGVCTAADQTEKVLTVATGGRQVRPGEQVRVLISRRTGLRAVAWGYIYPFLLLMAVLVTLTATGMSELHSGLWSLASLAPYYLAVYLFREKIGSSFTFKLEKP